MAVHSVACQDKPGFVWGVGWVFFVCLGVWFGGCFLFYLFVFKYPHLKLVTTYSCLRNNQVVCASAYGQKCGGQLLQLSSSSQGMFVSRMFTEELPFLGSRCYCLAARNRTGCSARVSATSIKHFGPFIDPPSSVDSAIKVNCEKKQLRLHLHYCRGSKTMWQKMVVIAGCWYMLFST